MEHIQAAFEGENLPRWEGGWVSEWYIPNKNCWSQMQQNDTPMNVLLYCHCVYLCTCR